MRDNRSQRVRKSILIGLLVLIWLVALAFYWSIDPLRNANTHGLASLLLSYLLLWGLVFLLSTASNTEMAKRFLLTSASITLTIGLFEGLALAHIVDFRLAFGTTVPEPWKHPDNLLDPKLFHIRKPYYQRRFDGIEYRYDRNGLRNEVDLKTADIVVLGDSLIEGWGVPATDLMTFYLAKELDRTVANVAQSWYGPQQELELLRRYGLALQPKACVWSFFEGNDLGDVHRYRAVIGDWGGFSDGLRSVRESFRERAFSKNAVLAVRRILDSWRYGERAKEWDGIRSGVFEESNGRKTRMVFLEPNAPLSAKEYEALEEVRSILRQAYELCRRNDARFLVIFIPTKFRVYSRFTGFAAAAHTDLPQRLEAIVRAELPDGEFLDLTVTFTEAAKRGVLTYFPGYDTHWSPEGHRVAAAAVARSLRRSEREQASAEPHRRESTRR